MISISKKGIALIVLIFLSFISIANFVEAQEKASSSNIKVEPILIGNENAPKTLWYFASLTCHYCAQWETEVFPKIKKELVDTGKINIRLVPIIFDLVGLKGAAMLYLLPQENRSKFIKEILTNQTQGATWIQSKEPVNVLINYAKLAGGDSELLDKLAPKGIPKSEEEYLNKIQIQSKFYENKHKIQGTPSFVVDGKLLTGYNEYSEVLKLINGK